MVSYVKNIINYSKAQRLSWFGHEQRMADTGTVKKIFNWKPLTKRPQRRPKYRWEDNIKQDICQIFLYISFIYTFSLLETISTFM
jgi:hypothetical protein